MPKKHIVPMQTIGYLLLIGGIALLLGRACVYLVSLGECRLSACSTNAAPARINLGIVCRNTFPHPANNFSLY